MSLSKMKRDKRNFKSMLKIVFIARPAQSKYAYLSNHFFYCLKSKEEEEGQKNEIYYNFMTQTIKIISMHYYFFVKSFL